MHARFGRTIRQLNTLFKNPDEQDPTEIEVNDPTHPLFGRRFSLISVSSPLHGAGFAYVLYREHITLRIPVTSTTLAPSRPVTSTKLTYAAVQELVTIAEDSEVLNAYSSTSGLQAHVCRPATPDHRRTLDDPTGGAS